MSYLEVRDLQKSYGSTLAVDEISFDVEQGSTLVLLGPSGCGKTTILRIIAGLLHADGGTVRLGGEDLLTQPIHRRDIGMVFQTWALFPHMTVAENVAFGLIMRKVSPHEREARVTATLDLVKLGHLAGRRPGQLSGGQQQRVALARALVTEPRLLLLDEPLSSLDYKIRSELRRELRRIQQTLGVTSVYVTHDHSEAMTLGDRVAVMSVGRMVEVGQPREVFGRPRTRYVSDFLGFDNIIEGNFTQDPEPTFTFKDGSVIRLPAAPDGRATYASIGISPWRVHLRDGKGFFTGRLVQMEYHTGRLLATVDVESLGTTVSSFVSPDDPLTVGQTVGVDFDWAAVSLLQE